MALSVQQWCGLALAAAVVGLSAAPASAQPQGRPRTPAAAQLSGDQSDPPPPVPPEVISRGENGRMVIRATRLTTPLRIDGRLDEEFYTLVPAISDFIQTVPAEGQPATEKTEAWVAFDENFIYISGKCYDSAPPEQWTANEMRRDTSQLRQNDMFGVLLDTYHDRRNGFNFYTNPLGGFADQWVTNEGNPNTDWNPVWQVRTGRFPGGWTAEFAIPFKSIRYNAGTNQEWGIQLRRSIRRKNEWTHLTFLPAATGGSTSIFRISRAATLIGLDLPQASKNIDLKPYGISRLTTDKAQSISNDFEPNVGVDMKVGITANLTADLTYNTDFSQVEVDEQQLNLTRFSIQFPEKRDFFLEGRGIFDFGRGGPTVSSAGAGGISTALTPTLFYSRAIGLNNGRVIPIIAGGRVTGKVGRYNVGMVNIETNEESVSRSPKTNFTVMRVSRDILRRSSIGMMLTNRSQSALVQDASNLAFGTDAAFSFFQNLNFAGFYAQSNTETRYTDNKSYQGRFDYAADRYGLRVEQLHVGNNFNPEVGFTRRRNFDRTFAQARFSPRPRKRFKGVRQFTYLASMEYIKNGFGDLETRIQSGRFAMERQNSDMFVVEANDSYELLLNPFQVATGVRIPRGGYSFRDMTVSYQLGQQRRFNGQIAFNKGTFYNGDITGLTLSSARLAILKQWSVEPSITFQDVNLPVGDFRTQLVRVRTDYGFHPRMFLSGLVQYATAGNLFSTNIRFRWEYKLGSELFVVYTDERDTTRPGYPDLRNQAFVVKFNRLMRF
jgi:hypothetical protein